MAREQGRVNYGERRSPGHIARTYEYGRRLGYTAELALNPVSRLTQSFGIPPSTSIVCVRIYIGRPLQPANTHAQLRSINYVTVLAYSIKQSRSSVRLRFVSISRKLALTSVSARSAFVNV